MSYTPEPFEGTDDIRLLSAYVGRELKRVSEALEGGQFTLLLLPTLHREPARLKENLIVAADGTDWDPGSGQGIYAYYNGAWNKLG